MVNIHSIVMGIYETVHTIYMYVVTHSDSVSVANKSRGGTNHKISSRKHMNKSWGGTTRNLISIAASRDHEEQQRLGESCNHIGQLEQAVQACKVT